VLSGATLFSNKQELNRSKTEL